MKVAYYSPLPPDRSGIADYSALLLPALGRHVELELAQPGKRPPRADIALYHLGNNPESHAWILEELRRRPGVVVLHDFVLHHLVAGMTLGRGDGAGYLDAMEREGGLAGRLIGQAVIEGRIPPLWETRPHEFPLSGEVLALAEGVIVHSGYVEARVREAGYAGPLWRIPHPAWPVPDIEPAAIEGSPLFAAVGHLTPTKRVPQLLAGFARFHATSPGARLLLAGQAAPGYDVERRIRQLALPPGVVEHEGYVDERRLWALLARSDAVISLRAPTMGETSGIALRALSLGKPLVVSDLGWFAELPNDVALKIPLDEREVDALVAAFRLVAEYPKARATLGRAAAEYARREHSLERVAELYAAALEEAAGGEAVIESLLGELAQAAAAVGLTETGELAGALRELAVSPSSPRSEG